MFMGNEVNQEKTLSEKVDSMIKKYELKRKVQLARKNDFLRGDVQFELNIKTDDYRFYTNFFEIFLKSRLENIIDKFAEVYEDYKKGCDEYQRRKTGNEEKDKKIMEEILWTRIYPHV